MDLALNDDQQMLVDTFTDLMVHRSSPQDVRAAEPLGFDPDLWTALGDVGPVPMAVAEEHGGWGASMVDLVLAAECLGRGAAAAPVVETQSAARLLAELKHPLLKQVLDDGQIITLALHPPRGGIATMVPAGAVADVVLVRHDDAVLAVRNSPRPAAIPNHASMPLADITVGADLEEVAHGPDATRIYEEAVNDWLLLTGGMLVGLASAALDLAVDYARQRRAFGSPIGSFQGVAHRLADAATQIDGARLLVREAAWSADTAHPEAAQRQCMAFAFAADAARYVTYWSVHTLGGYGVMLEYDAQLYFRRARGWPAVFGGPDEAYRRVASYRYQQGGAS